ncbi:MAG: hypothetical protein R3Y22_05200 [Bacteroidales bacterium]
MKDFIISITNAARKFNPLDYAIFKIYLISIGIILGAYLSSFFIKIITVMWTIVLITCVYVMFQLLRYTIKNNKGE